MNAFSTLRRRIAAPSLLKKAVPLLALCAVARAAPAQDAGGFRIGVKAGVTDASLAGDDLRQINGANYEARLGRRRLGFNGGVAFQIPISHDGSLTLNPEVLVNRKGYQLDVDQKTGLAAGVSQYSFEQTRALTYLDVPIMGRISAGGLYFELGPQFSYLMHASTETTTTTKHSNGEQDNVQTDTNTSKSALATTDIGAMAGMGYQTASGLSLGLRYSRGFTALLDTKNVGNEPKVIVNAVMLQVGYLLAVGK